MTIIVGTENSKFTLHKNFIEHHSPFFKGAFKNDNFIEGQTQSMTITDVEQEEFGIFANWLYTQKLQNEDGQTPNLIMLAQSWILAERFLIPALQNQVMDEIFNCLGGTSAERQAQFSEFADLAAEHGDGNSMLAKIASYCMVWCTIEFFDKFVDELPSAMLLATLKRMKKFSSYGVRKTMFHVDVAGTD